MFNALRIEKVLVSDLQSNVKSLWYLLEFEVAKREEGNLQLRSYEIYLQHKKLTLMACLVGSLKSLSRSHSRVGRFRYEPM